MTGLKRNLAKKVEKLLKMFPAVLILGARQVGKTILAKQVKPNWQYFDLENPNDLDFISRDYDFFFKQHPHQIILDEAQELPQLFKALRGVIDADRSQKGRFILTGSSAPELTRVAADSLAGRIGIVELGTLKMNEIFKQPLPDFYKVFEEDGPQNQLNILSNLKPRGQDTLNQFHKGGYPEPVLQNNEEFYEAWMDNYYQTYLNRDIRKRFARMDIQKYRRFIDMLSSLSGTIVNKAEVARSIDISQVSASDYLSIANDTYIWRNIPSYEKTKSKSIIKMPKGYLRDSGLTHYIAKLYTQDKLLRYEKVGASFEAFVIEEIIKGLESLLIPRWETFYYRTRNGSEVDLVLDGGFGIIPIEIKFGTHTTLKQLSGLNRFMDDNQINFGILINQGNETKMITERIIQVPVSCI